LFFWIALTGLILLVGVVILRLLPIFQTQTVIITDTGLPETADPWQRWSEQAQKLTAQEDFRGACRAWYLSLVFWLDQEKQVRYQPTRTNFEYLQELADYPQLQQPLRQLVQIHERLWYGQRSGTAQDAQSCAEAVAQAQRSPLMKP